MTDTDTRSCRTCGAEFKRSPSDATVNCPKHRGRAARHDARTTRTTTTCYCGKTVVAVNGVSTGVTCPRECERDRV